MDNLSIIKCKEYHCNTIILRIAKITTFPIMEEVNSSKSYTETQWIPCSLSLSLFLL